jgi:hypothetical protein
LFPVLIITRIQYNGRIENESIWRLFMPRSTLNLLSFLVLFLCIVGVQAAENTDTEKERVHTVGTTSITLASVSPASIMFDKDVRVNGNELPADTYEIEMVHVAEDDAQIIFKRRTIDGIPVKGAAKERLRLAIRPEGGPSVDDVTLGIVPIIPEERPEGQRRRRRRPPPPRATLNLQWDALKASVALEMTGVLRRSTPPPEMPEAIRASWALVWDSLQGFVQESMEKHTEHFADNFESDWDDGGSQEAHEQMIGRMLYSGEFEGVILRLDKVAWEEEAGGVLHFSNVIIIVGSEEASLDYRIAMTDQGLKIVHLDGPKED